MIKVRPTLAALAAALLFASTTAAFAQNTTTTKTTVTTTTAKPATDSLAASTKTAQATLNKVKIKLPSDAQVLAAARRKGARLTRGGVVQPKTVIKEVSNGPVSLKPALSTAEKAMPRGKAEAVSRTRGGGGYAYIFIKPQNVVHLGHIGWGYWAPNMNYFVAGSTENYSAKPYISAGQNNGYWSGAYWKEAEMFKKFKDMGYYAYKKKWVANTNPDLAWGRACHTRDSGFIGVGWNCLDHTYYVLEGYGATGMPWKQTNPAPNGWFNAFPGTGYQLP